MPELGCHRWSLIAAQLPGRTDNDVKNHWNTKLKKKLSGMGIDPVTHKPFSHLMAEIATTLAPPQVAHLAEAALGCFKDEMLHLLTKKRVDFQLQQNTWDSAGAKSGNFSGVCSAFPASVSGFEYSPPCFGNEGDGSLSWNQKLGDENGDESEGGKETRNGSSMFNSECDLWDIQSDNLMDSMVYRSS